MANDPTGVKAAPKPVLAKFRTNCPKCYATIYRGDPIARIGRQWLCAACAQYVINLSILKRQREQSASAENDTQSLSSPE